MFVTEEMASKIFYTAISKQSSSRKLPWSFLFGNSDFFLSRGQLLTLLITADVEKKF